VRLHVLAARTPQAADPAAAEPWPLAEDVALRVLATPAWRGEDRLPELLAQWCAATTPATSAYLYLLADPAVDGPPETIEARVLAACSTAGADLEAAADVTVLIEPATAERDARLHAATHVYVPLHPACAGHERIARAIGNEVITGSADRLRQLVVGALVHEALEERHRECDAAMLRRPQQPLGDELVSGRTGRRGA
jgi:hypothetical protein